MYKMRKLLCILGLFQLLQCCFSQPPENIHLSIPTVEAFQFYYYMIHGSLIKPNKVLTSGNLGFRCNPECNFNISFNCQKYYPESSTADCGKINVNDVIPKSYYNTSTNDIRNQISILTLENSTETLTKKLIKIKKATDVINKTDCFIAAYVIEELRNDPVNNITKKLYQLRDINTFNKDNLVNKLTKKINPDEVYGLTKSSFKNLADSNEKFVNDVFTGKIGLKAPRLMLENGIEIVFQMDWRAHGLPILCTTEENPNEYVQTGVVTHGTNTMLKNGTSYEGGLYIYYYVEIDEDIVENLH